MATTNTYSGTLQLLVQAQAAFTVDSTGQRVAKDSLLRTWAAAGGAAPTISGFLRGTLDVTAGDLLLAHASDPLQGMGNAAWSDGFAPAGAKLKLLVIRNTDATKSITIAKAAANGLPVFSAAGDAVVIGPGGVFLWYDPTGTAALTTGSNDALTLTPSSANAAAELTAFYGP